MKKSKTDPTIKKKPKDPSVKLKKKRKTPLSSEGGSKIIKKKKVPRKSRWENTTEVKQDIKTETPVQATDAKKANARESPRIKSLLEDKKKIVEQLFIAVSEKPLHDIIPDYLRKRPFAELKALCSVELEKMSNDEILDIIFGKIDPVFKEQETQTDFNAPLEDTVSPVIEDRRPESESELAKDVEMEINEAQNQARPEILEEVAKDLGIPEGDAELLELEMRARAIRSLLKLKSNDESNLLSDEQ